MLFVLCAAGRARAEIGVSIQYQSAEHLELARRLSSELTSEGYVVALQGASEFFPCDASRVGAVAAPAGTSVWIRFTPSASGETVVASICYASTAPGFLETSASAPRSEPRQLALATAEALNGLRSKLPPMTVAPPTAGATPPVPARESAPPSAPSARPLMNSASLSAGLLLNLPDFPAAPGIDARVTLGLGPSLGIVIDAFVPVGASELTSAEVTARVRTTWLRLGPRISGSLGRLQFAGAVLAGPALTWATGSAQLPRIGTTDLTAGAVASLAAFVEYPRHGLLFVCASASASALLPGVRVSLGDHSPAPYGAWLFDGSIGFGARWGGP